MRKLSFIIIALLLSFNPLKAYSLPQAPSNLLDLAWSLENQVSFAATETTGVYIDGHREFNVSRVFVLSPNKFRREYMYPSELAGDILIDDGIKRYYYQAKERVLIIGPTMFNQGQKKLQEKQLQLIFKNYNVTQSPSKFLDRDVTKVTISYKEDKKPLLALWIDNETYIVLKRELYSSDGKVRQYSFYVDIEFNPNFNESLFVWQKPVGLLKTIEQREESTISLQEAQKRYPDASSIPSILNNRYECLGVRESQNGLIFQFSDGIKKFLVFSVMSLPPLPPIATEKIVNGQRVFYWEINNIEGIAWNYKNRKFLVIGQLEQNIIERLIEDIK